MHPVTLFQSLRRKRKAATCTHQSITVEEAAALSYAPMSTPALSKFDRIPVRVVNPHRPLPRFFVRRLEKLHPLSFQLFVKCIEVIRRQLNVDACSLTRCRAL